MANKKNWLGILVVVLVFGMTLAGCGGDNDSDNENVTKTDAVRPTITVEPVEGAYLPGATVTPLSVTASVSDGGTLSYQWYSKSTAGASSGTEVSNATNATFTPSTATAGTVYYYVEVTNTNDSVNGIKTAVQTSKAVKLVSGWEKVDALEIGTFSPRSIVFVNNRFVAVGGFMAAGGQIGWSDNGVNWEMVENTPFGASIINGVASGKDLYGNDIFVAVGDAGKMASSADGKTWTSLNASSYTGTTNLNDIAYGNDRFYVVGDGAVSAYTTHINNSQLVLSKVNVTLPSGGSYFGSATGTDDNLRRIVYGDRFFTYALSINAQVVFNDGTASTWQGNPISGYGWSGTANIFDLIYADKYIVAVGNNGNVWKHDDDAGLFSFWTDISPPGIFGGTDTILNAAYGSGKLLVFSSNKAAWSSDDGETWTELPYADISRMAYGAGRFVGVAGGSGIFYSTYP